MPVPNQLIENPSIAPIPEFVQIRMRDEWRIQLIAAIEGVMYAHTLIEASDKGDLRAVANILEPYVSDLFEHVGELSNVEPEGGRNDED